MPSSARTLVANFSQVTLPNTAVRSFSSSTYTPGQPLTVTIVATPDPADPFMVYAVEDGISSTPGGPTLDLATWNVTNVDNGGAYTPGSANDIRKMEWGLYFDSTPRTLHYTLTPPVGTTGTLYWKGNAAFNSVSPLVTGQSTLTQ